MLDYTKNAPKLAILSSKIENFSAEGALWPPTEKCWTALVYVLFAAFYG